MKISEIKVTPINIPLETPFLWSGGLAVGNSKAIIEVETDEGITGLGEAPSAHYMPIIESFTSRLLGTDPLDLAEIDSLCVPPWQIQQNTTDSTSMIAFGGLEIALWDIRGKAWNQPLYRLLGGAVRKEIPFVEYFAFRMNKDGVEKEMNAQAIVDYCLEMQDKNGSTFFEGKLIKGDPNLEIETARLLRESLGPDAIIRLDSNMQYSLATAQYVLRELEPYNIRNYEDPVATFEEMASLRQHSPIPFSTHVPDIRRAVLLGVPDTFVTNFAVLGGINKAMRFIGACEAMGKNFWCYSGDAGICTAAYLHMSAAMPLISEPNNSVLHWQIGDVIEGGPFNPKNNVVPVPEGPGLGIKLDRDALKHWHRHYLDNGPLLDFYNPAKPGYFQRLPLI